MPQLLHEESVTAPSKLTPTFRPVTKLKGDVTTSTTTTIGPSTLSPNVTVSAQGMCYGANYAHSHMYDNHKTKWLHYNSNNNNKTRSKKIKKIKIIDKT